MCVGMRGGVGNKSGSVRCDCVCVMECQSESFALRLQDVAPSAVKFDVEVPGEVLRKGWLPTLRYLRELRMQGGAPVREARVFLLGEGKQGKTSLLRALLDSDRNLTDHIADDDRTVGIDVQVCLANSYKARLSGH